MSTDWSRKLLVSAAEAGLGAGLLYFLDPVRGRRRRAELAGGLRRDLNILVRELERSSVDIGHRAQGSLAKARRRSRAVWSTDGDRVVEARARSAIGHRTAHAHVIGVAVQQGIATLSGPVLATEAEEILTTVKHIQGVRAVVDHLERHDVYEHAAKLRGGLPRDDRRWRIAKGPERGLRLAAGATGAALGLYGLARGGALGTAAVLGGGALLAAALPRSTPRAVVEVNKLRYVNAPVERVHAFWKNLENAPLYLSWVRGAHVDDQLSQWQIVRANGKRVWITVRVIDQQPGRALVIRTQRGAAIEQIVRVVLEPTADGGTMVDARFELRARRGMSKRSIARFVGGDPHVELDEAMHRMKRIIEGERAAASTAAH